MRTLTFNRVIGAGAMGTVYHAELRAPGGFSRACAVKVMKTVDGDHEHFVARMRDEARLLGMLQDEQILGVSELVRVNGKDAVVMEYVEGADLHELRDPAAPGGSGGAIPARALAEIGAEAAGALHRAHNATHPTTRSPLGVVHRDVKPANVMITSRGGVRLLDFGVARAAFGGRESQTRGLVLGTLNYFAPEILLGAEPTAAVDVYGLALTLWECVAREDWGPPVVKLSAFEQRLDRRLGSLPTAYRPLAPMLRRMLAFEPQERPSGADVEKELLALAERLDGGSLRTWARDAVPKILETRAVPADEDTLVGKTVTVEDAETAPPAQAREGTDWARPAPEALPSQQPTVRRPVAPRKSSGGLPLWAMAGIGVLVGTLVGVVVIAFVVAILMIVTT
jgi:serine/threonine protein kinase